MAQYFYNVTVTSQASNILYSPARDGPIAGGWNLTYTGTANFTHGNNAVGNDSRRTTLVGATLETDWVGTAAYVYGSAEASSYTLSIDGQEPEDGTPDPSSGLLGKFEGLGNANHTFTLNVTNGTSLVEFREMLLTIQLGDDEMMPQNRTVPAAVNDEQRWTYNSFYTYTPSGLWGVQQDEDMTQAADGSWIRYSLPRVSATRAGDAFNFTLTNASAFFLYGAANYEHLGFWITVTPPETEGGPRSRFFNQSSTYFEPQHLIYWESGLNRGSEYAVQVVNPGLKFGAQNSTFGLRYMDVIDAIRVPPQPRRLSGGAIAGVMVGVVAFAASIVTLIVVWILHQKRQRRRAEEELRPDSFRYGDPGSDGNVPEQPPVREVDAGPLPPMYDDAWDAGGQPHDQAEHGQNGPEVSLVVGRPIEALHGVFKSRRRQQNTPDNSARAQGPRRRQKGTGV